MLNALEEVGERKGKGREKEAISLAPTQPKHGLGQRVPRTALLGPGLSWALMHFVQESTGPSASRPGFQSERWGSKPLRLFSSKSDTV